MFECPYYRSRWCAIPNGINLWPEYVLKHLCPIMRKDDLGISATELEVRVSKIVQIAEKIRPIDEDSKYPEINCLENYAEKILSCGKLFSLEGAEFIKGRPHECHWNSASLFNTNPTIYRICVGYAMFDYEWFQHTWLIKEENGHFTLVDPTTRFEKYFGYMMTAEKSKCFCQLLDGR